MDIKKNIMKKLLDKYEKSNVYKTGEAQNRRIIVTTRDFRSLDFEDYEVKSSFVDALLDLKKVGVLDFSWIRFEEGNLVDKIWLSQESDCIESAYGIIGITPTSSSYSHVATMLENHSFMNYPWMESFKQDVLERFYKTGKFGNTLSSNHVLNQDIVRCFIEIDRLSLESVHERVLSTSVYGDSKYFQKNVKGKLSTIINKYNDLSEDENPMDLVCVITNPEMIHYYGQIVINFNGWYMDSTLMYMGSAIIGRYVPCILSIDSTSRLKTLLTVENRASYELIVNRRPDNCLVVYTGGFIGLVKRQFLTLIVESIEFDDYYHWSDIDLGGARIYKSIKETISGLKPILMNHDVLSRYKGDAVPVTSEYLAKVSRMQETETDAYVNEVLDVVLEYKATLEQEFIDVNEMCEVLEC